MSINERLKIVADRYGTVAKLADDAGIKRTTFYGWTKDGIEPPASSLVKVSELSGCDLRWLLTGKGEPSLTGKEDYAEIAAEIIGKAKTLARLMAEHTHKIDFDPDIFANAFGDLLIDIVGENASEERASNVVSFEMARLSRDKDKSD